MATQRLTKHNAAMVAAAFALLEARSADALLILLDGSTDWKRIAEMGDKCEKPIIVAVDTEADSFYHYFDKTCLVQIATKRQIYLLDPLAFGGPAELSPLAPIMASPDIRKIFHG